MKKQLMIGAMTVGLMAGCASYNDNEVIEESAGVSTEPSVGLSIDELPPAVQATIRARSPEAKIDDIDRELRSGRVVYEVQFSEPGQNPKMHIAEDGSLVDGD